MNQASHNILITGAGPSGLALATELTRRGIAYTIIDKAPGPAPLHESRALAFNSRSQNILSPSGVTDGIKEKANYVNRVRFCWNGKLRNEVTLNASKDTLNEITIIRQGQVERELLHYLAKNEVNVHWNTELTNFIEKDNKITATLSPKDGESRDVQCAYLVGCDGAHSFVRKNAGYIFDGESDSQLWALADINVSDDRYAHTLTADLQPGKAYATVPIEKNLLRLIHNGPNLLEQHPFAHLRTSIAWQSEFKVSYRLVKQYNRGLTFLCGDAAHIHSPVGGRGMNLGIEDAASLAWLLEQGRESEYSNLRRPVAKKVLQLTHNQTSQMNSSTAFSSFLKQFGPKLISLPTVRRKMLKSVHGLDTPEPDWIQ